MDYAYFKGSNKLIAVDLSKQQALDTVPRAIQQIVFQGIVGGENKTHKKDYTPFLKNQKKQY